MSNPKPLVFIAAVYEGNASEYVHGLVRAARSLRGITSRVVPVLPDLRLVAEDFAGDRFSWEWDLIGRCDALVVIGGRDVPDVDAALEMDIPVFDGPGALVDWLVER